MYRAMTLALEIYARVPLIPQPLFMNGLDIQIDIMNEDFPVGYHNGTLANGNHKIEVMFWSHWYGIFVCYLPFLAALDW